VGPTFTANEHLLPETLRRQIERPWPHPNISDEEKDAARDRLADFFDHSTKETFTIFAWLMSHYAARSEFTDLLQHARTTQAAQMKFDPTLRPYLQNMLFTIGQAGKSFVIRAISTGRGRTRSLSSPWRRLAARPLWWVDSLDGRPLV
jgi:hypothetical protein